MRMRNGRPTRGAGPVVPPGRYGVAVRVKSDTLAEAGLTVLPDPGDDPGLFRRKPGSYDEWLLKKQRAGGWKGE